jgi:UrcA family protein
MKGRIMVFQTVRPALAPGFSRVAALAALLTLTGPAFAAGIGATGMANGASEETITIAVRHINRQPQTPAAAQTVLRRLGKAAFTACGGSGFSLEPVKAAILDSQCWHNSMRRAVNEVNSPLVTQMFERNSNNQSG